MAYSTKSSIFLLTFLLLFVEAGSFPTLHAQEPQRMLQRVKKKNKTGTNKKKRRQIVRYRKNVIVAGPTVVIINAPPPTYIETGARRPYSFYETEEKTTNMQQLSQINTSYEFYAKVNLAYTGIRGDYRANDTIFSGLGYGVSVGYSIPFIAGELGFEGSNHWYEYATGWPIDLNLYSIHADIRAQWRFDIIEPYLYLGFGASLYHPNPERVSTDIDLWDFGSIARAGAGIQLNLRHYAFAVEYGHRWFNFGGGDAEYEDLTVQASSYRLSVSYYF